MTVSNIRLTYKEVLTAFAVKVLMGCIYGYIFMRVYSGDDTWELFNASLKETELLKNDPARFFIREYTPLHSIEIGKDWIHIIILYLNDLQYALLVKSMALMNLVSQGNYYINSILFNILLFFGHYWLFRLMVGLFPGKRKFYLIAVFFFLPAIFWLSGIRVDGLLFFFLSLYLYQLCREGRTGTARNVIVFLSFLGVLICRPQVAFLLGIGSIAYLLAGTKFRNAPLVFTATYGIAIVLFFASALFIPEGGLPEAVQAKQQDFMELEGTRFNLDKMEPSPSGFARVFPQAVANTFFRPLPWEAKGFLQMVTSAEMLIFWLIIIMAIKDRHRYWKIRLLHPVILLLLFFSISVYLAVGYIVPFPGAIVRYKVIAELLLICCAISISKWGEKTYYNKL